MNTLVNKFTEFIKKSSNGKLLLVIPFSMISGMPLAIIITSMMTWLTEAGIAISVITSFAIAKIFYSIKFFWAPILDVYSVPFLSFLGKRKSWMIFISLLLAGICFAISLYDPKHDIMTLKLLTIALGIASATYDICWDGTRIEMLSHEDQATGIVNAGIGYRLGMLISGPFALVMSIYYGWNKVFFIFGLIFLLGIILILFIKLDQKTKNVAQKTDDASSKTNQNLSKLYSVLMKTLKQVFLKKYIYIILPAIILYKLGDAMLGVVSTTFFLRIGYTKMHIAEIVKIYGLIATFLGQYCGSFLIRKTTILKALVICGILQAVTNLTYMWLNHQEIKSVNLFVTICTENFTGGMGAIALVSYLTYFCEKNYDNTSTHYALLSALAVMMNSTVTSKAGTIIETIGWDKYFIFTVMISIPGVLLFLLLNRLSRNEVTKYK